MDGILNQEILTFFEGKPQALALFETFARRLTAEIGEADIRVQKTQIAFSNRHNFAFASFLPVRKAKERPEQYIVITFGLGHRVESPRIDGAVEPYPNRWTHHVLISKEEEIDGELMGWVKEAAEFAALKRRASPRMLIFCLAFALRPL